MSSPFTRERTEDEELMYDGGLVDGRIKERERIVKILQDRYYAIYEEYAACDHAQVRNDLQTKAQTIKDLIGLIKYGVEKTPCDKCGKLIDSDIHTEELGMCLDCSNAYFDHKEN